MAINIFQMQDYRRYLGAVLQKRCLRNPHYSLRAFARDIDMAASFLSLLLNRKKFLSLEKAGVVAERLALPDHEKEYFLALVERDKSGDEAKVLALRQRHAFQYLRGDVELPEDISLQEFALLQQIGLLGKVEESEATAELLGLEFPVLSAACKRLHALGWLNGSPDKGWSSQRGLIRTEAYKKSESIRIFHQKVLELGLKQLHEGEVEERYFNSLVFSFTSKQYEAFCKELNSFCLARCDAYSSRDSHDRIYTLGVQLLPLAKLKRKTSRYSDGHGQGAEYMKGLH